MSVLFRFYGYCTEQGKAWRAPFDNLTTKEYTSDFKYPSGPAAPDTELVEAVFSDGSSAVISEITVADHKAMKQVDFTTAKGPLWTLTSGLDESSAMYKVQYKPADKLCIVMKSAPDLKKPKQVLQVHTKHFATSVNDSESEHGLTTDHLEVKRAGEFLRSIVMKFIGGKITEGDMKAEKDRELKEIVPKKSAPAKSKPAESETPTSPFADLDLLDEPPPNKNAKKVPNKNALKRCKAPRTDLFDDLPPLMDDLDQIEEL